MSKMIGKIAVFALSAVASGTVAAVIAVKKTDAGAKLWTGALENLEIQKTRIHSMYADGYAASKEKFNDLKKQAAARGEAKAIATVLAQNEELRKELFELVAAGVKAKKAG